MCSLPSSVRANDPDGLLRLALNAPHACDLLAGPGSLPGYMKERIRVNHLAVAAASPRSQIRGPIAPQMRGACENYETGSFEGGHGYRQRPAIIAGTPGSVNLPNLPKSSSRSTSF